MPIFQILNGSERRSFLNCGKPQNRIACDWLFFESVKLFTAGPYTIYVWEIGFDNLDFFSERKI